MTQRKILVTGGTGFVGSHVVTQLVEAGHSVKVLTRASSSLRALSHLPPGAIEVAQGDITVEHTVYRALAGCDRLFHVATEFRMWDRDPEKILGPAILGTRETLLAARKRGIEKIVVTSSTATIGASETPDPMDERTPFNREHSETYIRAKWQAEQVALQMAAAGMPIVVVNPGTVLGPGDFKPTPSGEMLLTLLNWNKPFALPYTGGGINVVDVDDVARGHVLAMEKGRVGERYLLGGHNVTFHDLFSQLAEVSGLPGPGRRVSLEMAALGGALMEVAAALFGGVPTITRRLARDYADHFVWVSSRKATEELGYHARPLRRTLQRAVRFFADHHFIGPRAKTRMRADLLGS